MKLLLDTHIFVFLVDVGAENSTVKAQTSQLLINNESYLSITSLWEIAIKYRLGKLHIHYRLDNLPDIAASMGIALLDIKPEHVLTEIDPEPPTRDPFDRLLLAQCKIEGMRLVTIDRALVTHPLAIDAS